MRKIFKNITLVVALLFCCAGILSIGTKESLSGQVGTVYAANEHNHEEMTAWESATSLPTSGSYYLTSDVSISSTCTVSGTLNLCLNGHGIRFTGTTIGSGSVFNLQDGKTLNLYDCGEIEHKYKIQPADIGTYFNNYVAESPAGLATVDDTLTENYQTFTGGYITGGIGMTRNNSYYNGGAVYILGGTFNMYGGTLIGNTVKNPSSSGNNGGAVFNGGGNFTMNGGAIIGNTVDVSNNKTFNCGGAVYVAAESVNGNIRNARVTMNGGIIKQNYAISGGAIFTGSNSNSCQSILNINNVKFTENVAYGYSYSGTGSGGVLCSQGGDLTFNNCEFSDNIGYDGGAIRFYSTSYQSSTITNHFTLNGCNIANNIGYSYGGMYVSTEVADKANMQCLVANISNSHIDSNKTISSGAAFYLSGYSRVSSVKSVQLTMTNSTVNNNVTNRNGCVGMQLSSNTSYYNGPEVTLTDCEITGNTSSYSGEPSDIAGTGLTIGQKSTLNISGKVIIAHNKFHNTNNDVYKESNLYFSDTTNTLRINIVDNLSEDSLIGVVKYKDPYYTNPKTNFGTGPVTSGLNNKGSIDNFFSDKEEFYIIEENGEAVLNEKVSVTYNKNDAKRGSVPPVAYYIPNEETVTVADNVGELVKSGHRFVGWNTLADGTGTLYQPGDTFDISENITLYAIFEHTSHNDIDFALWSDELATQQNGSGKTSTNSLPSVAGDYYFVSNITLSNTWNVPEGITNICFNGFSISTNSGAVVYVPSNATLNLYDEEDNYGKITGGKGGYDGKRGGGMYVEGDVTMYGGSITANEAAYGGGVYIKNGSFTMYNNARVTSNKSKTSYDSWANGGGFLIDGGTLTLYGGYISNNTADREDSAIALASGNLYLYGGTITNNTAGMSGSGAVRNYGSGNIYVSGNPYIMNNNTIVNNVSTRNDMYLINGKKLIVDGELNQNAKIGVTVQNSGVFTQGLLNNGTASNFYSDNTNYGIIADENGEVELYPSNAVAVINKSDGHTYYTSFADALNNWADGTTLKILADVSGTQITVSSGTKTLDLNNHSVTYTSGSVIIVSGGKLYIKDDSTSKTKHYYNINTTGVASISTSTTNNYFEGGYITGGVATDSRGGGLRVTGGEVNFAGGTIFACRAGWGGGIWTAGTSLVTISDSAAIVGCYSSGGYTSGGGIFCEGSGAITMTGGSIKHNSSQFSGGGVRVSLQETTGTYFTMTGGEITGNYSGSHQGSGLALDMANRIKIGGSARIYGNDGDNLFLKNGGYVTVVEPFTEDALIYVKTQTLPTESNSIVITDGWTTVMGDADFKNIFKWENDDYRIKRNKDGELVASVLHIHNWTFSAQDDVITATCIVEEDDECTIESQTLTLVVLGKIFDGTAVVATTSKSEGWTVENGLAEPGEIVYSGNINAGTYIASITAGGVTATKEFTIKKITATVTITGNHSIVDYDGSLHEITGYVADVDSVLYDVEDDFVFSGLAKAERTNAGTTYMGLTAEMFENTNSNFDDVTFVIVDGYQTVLTVDAVIITLPSARDIVANNLEQELIVQGEVDGGTLQYSVVMDMNEVPDAESYNENIPTAVNAGFYYIWYKVVADENHNNLEPAKLKMVFAGADWVVLNGVLYQSDETTEIANVKVSLKKGNQTIDFDFTNDNGEYLFKAPKGVYNLVAEHSTDVETLLVEAFENKQQDIVISGTKTESKLEVNTEDENYSGISVGGLNTEAYDIRQNDGIDDSISLSILMTVEPKAQDVIANADDIIAVAKNKSLEFLDIKVKKTIDTVTTTLSETINILEIVVPYEKINRHDLIVYSYHGLAVKTFVQLQIGDEISDGTFYLDKENKYIYIYSKCFSTFAIGYTPHYKVDTTISLGSFEGTANLTLVSQDDGTVYTLTDVDTTKVSFDDIPMGDYILTISWEDGVVNTLTMPIRISGKDSTIVDTNQQNAIENNLGATLPEREVNLIESKNNSLTFVDKTIMCQSNNEFDMVVNHHESVIESNNDASTKIDESFENVEIENIKVLERKSKTSKTENQQKVLLLSNTQTERILKQEQYFVLNQNMNAIFEYENISIAEIGFADKYGNLVKFDVGYIMKRNKGELKNV